MSTFDKYFKDTCRKILDTGTETVSRAVWEDGTNAKTKKIFGVVHRYDLSKEVPIMTLRNVGVKNCIDELLWIYSKKSSNIKDLNSHIWDQWADENGSIGAAYGYQVATQLRKVSHGNGKLILDQMNYVLHELKYNPFSRKIIINLYSVGDVSNMMLDPCCYSITFNVTINEHGKKVLNAILNQRSQDMIVANGWNTFQYSILVYMIANLLDMVPGELIHVISDCHIYDRHFDIARDLINREEYNAPTILIDKVPDFYAYTVDSVHLSGYKYGPQIKNIPVAV